jgi:hypothetical protein
LGAFKTPNPTRGPMNHVLHTSKRTLVSLSSEELLGLVNALNEVCNGINVPETEFQTRLGVSKALLFELHQGLLAEPDESALKYERVDAWAEPASVMVRAVSVFGDAVEMSTLEAEAFISQVQQAIETAS